MSFRKENKFRLTVSDMKLLKSELISERDDRTLS